MRFFYRTKAFPSIKRHAVVLSGAVERTMKVGLSINAYAVLDFVSHVIHIDPVQNRSLVCDGRYQSLEFLIWIRQIVTSEWVAKRRVIRSDPINV
jgi:hypothetical protein